MADGTAPMCKRGNFGSGQDMVFRYAPLPRLQSTAAIFRLAVGVSAHTDWLSRLRRGLGLALGWSSFREGNERLRQVAEDAKLLPWRWEK